jgi:site-specific DNA-adenine methylase|tara:strand:+ start:4083 stop:4850 length:768 start_codon:yes stop_codon:yes gene_type:complete
MKSPIKDATTDFKCLGILKRMIPVGSVVHSFLFYNGALEFGLSESQRFVRAHTNRYVVYEFWKCVLENPKRISEMVSGNALRFGNENMFHLLQESWPTFADPYLRASLFYILNRCSDQGLISTGKMDIKNFNALAISHLRNFKVQNFHLDFIKENEIFDKIPPTINADYLLLPAGRFDYNFFDTGKSRGFETTIIKHKEIAEQLKEMNNQKWILIYKNHPQVFELYKNHNIIKTDQYGKQTSDIEQARDVIIANF